MVEVFVLLGLAVLEGELTEHVGVNDEGTFAAAAAVAVTLLLTGEGVSSSQDLVRQH
jgi:hypothetical protein